MVYMRSEIEPLKDEELETAPAVLRAERSAAEKHDNYSMELPLLLLCRADGDRDGAVTLRRHQRGARRAAGGWRPGERAAVQAAARKTQRAADRERSAGLFAHRCSLGGRRDGGRAAGEEVRPGGLGQGWAARYACGWAAAARGHLGLGGAAD